MNILLVYPKYPDTFWSFKHILGFFSRKAAFPPLGLLTVASMLPSEWNKRLVDINVRGLTDEDLAWADVVFVSAMIVQMESAQKVISQAKAQGKKVVVGGPVFTTHPDAFEGIDHFVLNESEVTLPLFLEDFKRGEAKYKYTSSERPDITKTPVPMWSLIDFKNYVTMSLQYSRGCPFNCEFCDIVVMNGRIPRTKTADQFINEIRSLYDAGWRGSLFIVDDNFIGNKRILKEEILPRLIDWQKKHKYPFALLTEASTNLADDQELMSMMSAANFNKVFVGIESPNPDSLEECGKIQNSSRDLVGAVRAIQRHGMQVMGGFIVGFDSDTESVFDSQIKFIQKTGVVTAMVGLLNAIPGTS
ncbi:B12-binding domain-containing radical SAM protein [Nanoarchaeota archaeon]